MTPPGGSRHDRSRVRGGSRTLLCCLGVLAAMLTALTGSAQADPAGGLGADALTTPSTPALPTTAAPLPPISVGAPAYWEVGTNGQVYGFGVPDYGDLRSLTLNRPIVGTAANGNTGYWMVASDGGIFTYGSAAYYGSTGSLVLNQPIVGMAATPDGRGYWLVASDGGIFSFGDAAFYGSTGSLVLNQPIVGMAATPDGRGYWLVASDGGIFSFGDAAFYGSTGSLHLNRPIVGMASTPGGAGYWMVASDGGIFSFGNAAFYGSTGALVLNKPIVGMAASSDGGGYWLTASDGGVFSFGDATYAGSPVGAKISAPIVAIAGASGGDRVTGVNTYPVGSTGYDISWPQYLPDYASGSCDTPHLPPTGSPESIVGVNGGLSNELNPCFGSEARWAGANISVYINIDNLTATDPATSFATGASDAATDIAYVQDQGFFPQIWWLDVEGPCGSSNTLWQCGPAGQALNNQVIQGALSVFKTHGLAAGIYSTYLQWPEIAGQVSLAGYPLWIPTVPANPVEWAADCSTLSFAQGTPYLVQWLGAYTADGFDQDLACAA